MKREEVIRQLAQLEKSIIELDQTACERFYEQRKIITGEKLNKMRSIEKELNKLEITYLLGRFKFDHRKMKHLDQKMRLELGF